MADQKLGLEINTTSNVPQQLDKAKSSVVTFGKQIEDVQKKFSAGFKDIFLGFFAPMVLFQSLLQSIRDNIEQAKQMAKEGVDLIAKNEGIGQTKEEVSIANIQKFRQSTEEKTKQTEEGKKFLLNWFAYNTKEGKDLFKAAAEDMVSPEGAESALKKFGGYEGLLKKYLESEEGKKMALEATSANKTKDFKGPEGFSNVIGVGANPVIEAMNEQLEIQKQQLEELKKIASPDGGVPKDFTKDTK